MPPVTVLQTPNVTLYYHPDERIVHHEIRNRHGQDFRDLLTAGCDLMRKQMARKWLSDDRGRSSSRTGATRSPGSNSSPEWRDPHRILIFPSFTAAASVSPFRPSRGMKRHGKE